MSLKKEIIKGSIWIGIAKYSGILIHLLVSAILARLISPAAFGTIAVAIVILNFLNILADIGIGPAVVQYKELTKRQLDSLFTLNIYIGIFLSAILFFLSSIIADYYADVTLERVCQMMSLVIFFNSLNVVPNALMRKDKRFKSIALRTLLFLFLSGSIAVWGAFQGWGIYSLLVSPILTAIGVFCVNYYNYPLRYVLRVDRSAISVVSSFSIYQFAFSFFNYFSRNLDKLIIGKYFSLSQLGYYDKSYHLMILPLQNVTFVIEPVLHPILSTLQDNKHKLAEKNKKLAVYISNISFPIGLILYFCGEELIKIVYGNQWDDAIPVFKILALSLPLQMILSTSGAIYQAAGKTKHMFCNGIMNTACTITGFLVAATIFRTLESMAWAWNITLLINFLNSYYIMLRFTLHCNISSLFKAILPQAINSLIVFILTCFAITFVQTSCIFANLLIKTTLVLFLTVCLASILNQYKVNEILNALNRQR